jgi:HD-like signal output (HDOD) protein
MDTVVASGATRGAERDIEAMTPPLGTAPAKAEELLPLPAAAAAILRLSADERVSLDQIVEAISTDPVMLAEVLRVANLAFVGARGDVTSLKQAALFLGVRRVSGIAAAVALRSSLGSLWQAAEVRRCWLHNLASALTAEQIARLLHQVPDDAYSHALLHDVGRFALIVRHREPYLRLLREDDHGDDGFRGLERVRFGMDHTEAGRAVLTALGLPTALGAAAAGHHDRPTFDTSLSGTLTYVACRASTAMGFGVRGVGDEVAGEPLADLIDLLPEARRSAVQREAPSIVNVVATLVRAYERAFT